MYKLIYLINPLPIDIDKVETSLKDFLENFLEYVYITYLNNQFLIKTTHINNDIPENIKLTIEDICYTFKLKNKESSF
jgi:hypothetical protein